MAKFPTPEWAQAFMEKLNGDAQYADIAKNWEGDISFVIEPDGPLKDPMGIYLDLWHGKCRDALILERWDERTPAFVLKAPYGNFVKVLKGELHPMQAMMTRKLLVQGSLAVMMRSVPTVLDFVRCAQEITDSFIE